MKSHLFALALIACPFLMVSCTKETEQEKPGVKTLVVEQIGKVAVLLKGAVILPDSISNDFELGFELSTSPSFPAKFTQKRIVKVYLADKSFSYEEHEIKRGNTYYVRAYMLNRMCMYYGETISFFCGKNTDSIIYDGQAVDLGLSVKWSNVNVGADSPEEFGDYYAWGEIEPYYSSRTPLSWREETKDGYSWNSYFDNPSGDGSTFYKYDHKTGKKILELEDDAAYQNWSGEWRIPSIDEFRELKNNCKWTMTTINGISGYKVQSNIQGYEENFIFLPFAGSYSGKKLSGIGEIGCYWNREVETELSYCFYISTTAPRQSMGMSDRCDGYSIRPVCD